MVSSIPVILVSRRFIMLVAALALVLAFLVSATPAGAFHCYVENKSQGAGAVTFDDLENPKSAGKSGKKVVTGAFLDLSEFGAPDVFIRGKPVGEEELVGIGSLPPQPHESGSDTNGVQTLLPPPPPTE